MKFIDLEDSREVFAGTDEVDKLAILKLFLSGKSVRNTNGILYETRNDQTFYGLNSMHEIEIDVQTVEE